MPLKYNRKKMINACSVFIGTFGAGIIAVELAKIASCVLPRWFPNGVCGVIDKVENCAEYVAHEACEAVTNVENCVKYVAHEISENVEEVVECVAHEVCEVAENVEEVVERVAHEVCEVVENVEEVVECVAHEVCEAVEYVAHEAKEALECCDGDEAKEQHLP